MESSNSTTLAGSLAGAIAADVAALVAPEVDRDQCQLLGPLALVIQGLMGVFVLGSLVIKRAQENPKRRAARIQLGLEADGSQSLAYLAGRCL
jgi:hypothetical protein